MSAKNILTHLKEIIKYLSLNHIKNQHYENKKTLYQKV